MFLSHDLKMHFSTSSSIFEQMMALEGKCFRHQQNRITQQIQLGKKSYFIKQHFGVGWKEIFKNLFQLRWPVISAKNEWLAIHKLQSLNIDVPEVVAYGTHGWNPAALQSFIVMEELTPVVSLEEFTAQWRTSPASYALKRSLIEKIAHIARTLHQNGLNHRDFYLCHFLLDLSDKKIKYPISTACLAPIKLYLIDLHRVQIRHLTPARWAIKDLAGLYFSSKEIGLTQRDLYRFMQCYHKKSLREIMRSHYGFWMRVKSRGEKLYSHFI